MTTQKLMTNMQDDVAVVTIQEARILDERNIQSLAKELNELVDKKYCIKMILNFQNVQYLSSAAIGKIVALFKRLMAENGELKLCSVKKEIMEIFKVTGLDKQIDIHPRLEDAVAAFKNWKPKKKGGDPKKEGGFWGMFKK